MSRVGFVMLPEAGHVNASLKIAKSLKARGHRVCYFGLADFEDYIVGQGLEFLPVMADHFPKGFLSQNSFTISTFEVLVSMLGEKLGGGNITAFDLLKSEVKLLIERVQPQLVVSDALLADLAFIIHSSGIPLVFLNTTLFYPWDVDSVVTHPLQRVTTIYPCPQEFNFPYAKKREWDHYVEASIDVGRKEVEFPFDQLDEDRRLIYCSLGSQAHLYSEGKQFLQVVVDVMWEKQDCQMILATGPKIGPGDLCSIPPNVFIVQTAPQLQILKRASMMITHGGLNSIKECVYFGVPMIIFPMLRDQPLNAARVAYHGLGVRGDLHKLNARELLGMMNKVDGNPAFKMRVEKMGKRFREIEEAQPSLHIIEKALSSACPAYKMK